MVKFKDFGYQIYTSDRNDIRIVGITCNKNFEKEYLDELLENIKENLELLFGELHIPVYLDVYMFKELDLQKENIDNIFITTNGEFFEEEFIEISDFFYKRFTIC